MSHPNIAVVGTGRMGANMARRLHECEYPVTALYDARTEIAQALAQELGSTAFTKLADVTAAADIIITVVTDDAAMEKVFLDADDSLLKNAQGKLFINCATVTPGIHQRVEKAAQAAGAQSLEGCMASSITQAREGTLYLMCGGESSAYRKAEPVLQVLGKEVRYIGTAGQAAQLKALVNMVMNINTAALAEGLGLADSLGLDLTTVREVFSQTGANSRVLETDGEDMQNRDHECYFSAAHAAKDSGIALDLGKAAGLDLPLAAATLGQYQKMVEAGLGELDKSGVAELTFAERRPK